MFAFLIIYSSISLCTYFAKSAVVENGVASDASARGIDAKTILSSIATNFLSRGYYPTAAAGSQVVSLNLTNLLVLVLLKALIFAAGSIGLGHLKEKEYSGYGGYYGRSLNDDGNHGYNLVVTEDEMLLYLGYLTGNHECLKSIACRQPVQTEKYLDAGELLIGASKLFSISQNSNTYENVLKEVERAVEIGRNNGDCDIFRCTHNDYT